MKAIFKLKEKRNTPKSGYKYEFTNDKAEYLYWNSKKFNRYVPRGLYNKELNFSEWLAMYCIKIV